MYEYLYTCHCCKSTEGVEMRQVTTDRQLPLCPECADLHEVHSTRLIKAVRGRLSRKEM